MGCCKLLHPKSFVTQRIAIRRKPSGLVVGTKSGTSCPSCSHPTEQVWKTNLQTFSNLLDIDNGDVPNAPLNTAVVGTVKAAAFRSLFLIDLSLFANTADGAS